MIKLFYSKKRANQDILSSKLYNEADVFVLTSLWEGMPLTLLEGWAMGLPVISSPLGFLKDTLYDQSVLKVRIGDEISLASAMDRIMNDEHLVSILVRNGKQEVGKLSWDSIGALILDLYKRTIAI